MESNPIQWGNPASRRAGTRYRPYMDTRKVGKFMCNKTFYIQDREAATRWLFDEEYGADGITKLELALWKFAEEHNRHWSIFINGVELPFEYEPDLTTIFNDIPEVLELLLNENKEPAILDFFEQGTSIALSMKRKNNTIWIKFQKTHPLTGKRFDHLPEEPQPILVRDFYEAWFQFLDEILKSLTRQEHNLATDLNAWCEFCGNQS